MCKKEINLIVIIGPTASGKSDFAVDLAKKVRGEIISADSRQVYRGMDIGTGKITLKEMKDVPHHLIDVVSPKTEFDVTKFVKSAKKAIEDISTRGKVPIVVGGTGFWVDSLVYDMEFPNVKPDRKLRGSLEKQSTQELFSRLKKLDPSRASIIDEHNKRRLVRALEIIIKTGKVIPSAKKGSEYDVRWIGLKVDSETLEKRIGDRFVKWLDGGFVNEVKFLHKDGVSWKRLEELGMNYRAVARFLQDKISHKEMIDESIKSIIQYSKRQMTWFKRNKEIRWFTIGECDSMQLSSLLAKDF